MREDILTDIPNTNITEIDMGKHAVCSPSSFDRWQIDHCPFSAQANAKIPSKSSYYASEGTVMHEIAEMELKGKIEGVSLEEYWVGQEIQQEDNTILVTNDLIEKAKIYIDYVKNRTEELKGKLLIEEKVQLDEIHESIWGTSDAIILGDNHIAVIDFKFGKFPVKPPQENYQLWIYSLGALSRYGDINTKVEMTIVQPRSTNKKYIQTYEISSDALVDWGYRVLKPSAEACFEDAPPKRAGDWCRFCNYKDDCDEYKRYERRVMNVSK